MRQIITFILVLTSLCIFGQDTQYSDKEIQQKLDSIKAEGNLLFSLENASWNSSDLLQENQKLRDASGPYLTYKNNDTVKTVFLNKEKNLVIAEYAFTNNSKKPVKEVFSSRALRQNEISLKNIRDKVISQLSDPKYEVGVPEGFSLNIITIPFNEYYKTYLIAGASQAGVIPFGNDYLFISDKEGNIISSKRFHSRLIPAFTSGENGTLTMATHSHLRTTPFISATDICTFKLYAPFSKLEEFSVYSPALQCYMKYNYKKDILEVSKKP
ncbi:hypothetical protein CHRYSEOSP005_15760 [Chryseobacterium sp. Alg-005]|uniref:hypothetical protein n=1 Tax=Chryseobacterium sp. Alg-005 TaxID=3159516 RepID=UPI0035557291